MHGIVTAFVERIAQVADCRVVRGPPSRDAFHDELSRLLVELIDREGVPWWDANRTPG